MQSLSQLTSLELDFNRCDNRCILTTSDFKGGGFPYGGDSISWRGGDFETEGDFSNETDPPAGDFISAGGDFLEEETLFCDTGLVRLHTVSLA